MSYDMHVLHLIGSMDPLTGGPCQGIRSASPALEELKVHREVVCFDPANAAYLGTDRFPIVALGKGKSSWQYNPKLIPWLQDHLHRFDVVITNGLWLYHSNAVRQVIAEMKKMGVSSNRKIPKWYIMPHGMLDPYFQRASDRKLKAIRNWFYWKFLEHKVVEEADGLLFTCETELLMARETFTPYRPKREINVGYGIENPPAYSESIQEAFLEKCPEIGENPFLLFLSRIHPKKGIDLLLKAYINLGKTLAGTQTRLPKLVIAGPGIDTDFGRSVKKMAQKNPDIWSEICFTGMLTGDAKWGAFYGCEAFVLPSHQENFGIAVAEALACSRPVLISNQVNIWREIANEGGGLVEDNSVEGAQKLLNQWLDLSASEKLEMGKRAKKTFEVYFGVEPAARRFKEAIE